MQLAGVPGFDAVIMEFIQNTLHNTVTDTVFPFLTRLGEAGAVWLILAAVLLCFKKTRTTGVLVLIAMALTFVTGELGLKNLICRPRPCHTFPEVPLLIPCPDSFSFPSGHSASSFTAAVMLFLRHKKQAWPALILAALIAFSRVFLFVHYPTDILAGALLGTLFACAVYTVYKRKFESKLH
ncbi:MAG: phosphatase PAP2 family protein [Clostridia bacterium]|nr:phosphatase PAP2 family protein [Clostridia bacterium]